MAIARLTAHDKSDVAKKIRRKGFTPAVVYGFGHEEGTPVQFKSSELLSIIRKHGSNARVTVEIGGKGEYGAIKEVQLHPVTNQIRHIDIQVFNQDDVVRLTVPVHFTGMDALIAQRLVVGTLMSEVEITGPAIEIPQSLTIDLSEKTAGDVVTVAELGIDNENLRLSADPTDALVTITEAEEEPEEVVEETDVEVELVSDEEAETEEE